MGARWGMNGLFVEIAKKNNELLIKIDKKLKEYNQMDIVSDDSDYEKCMLKIKEDEAITQTIVFTALAVESYIYDYGARNLGDRIMSENLDKLDVLSKWIIIPRMVTGKSLDKSKRSYMNLKKLVKARNRIIHNKSSEINMEMFDEVVADMIEKESELKQLALGAINILIDLAEEIENMDSNEHAKFSLCHISNVEKYI